MISFVWPPGVPMLAGTGGSETFTAGHMRELLRRGIKTQLVSVGHGKNDGHKDFPDIPFLSLKHEDEISTLSGTVVFVNRTYHVPTKQKAAVILHCVIPSIDVRERYRSEIVGKTVIATSIYSGQQWALYLDVPYSRMKIVLPFADPIFGSVKRSKPIKKQELFLLVGFIQIRVFIHC
jgi:D-inositol-3-phosphate glycosyltransferase